MPHSRAAALLKSSVPLMVVWADSTAGIEAESVNLWMRCASAEVSHQGILKTHSQCRCPMR